jgi:hypothetical protein
MLILTMLLVGMALIPAVNAQEDNFSEDEYNFPEYGPNIFVELKDDSNVIETRGIIPEMTEIKEQVEWLDKLETSIRSSKDELEPYMKEYGGPLVGFGINYQGYLFVEFDNELDTIDKSTIDKIYNIIEEDAKKIELNNIPVVFKIGEEETLDSRSSQWPNMYGGIRIVRSGNIGSTLSFAAKDKSSGTYGFVMSGHAAINAGGIGSPIYQPNTSRLVGYVEDIGGVYADAAWVEATNIVDDIYYTTDTNQKDVTDYEDADLGNTVYMSGISSSVESGTVTQEYVDQNSDTFGTLENQFSATYESASGDSGAPVYKTTLNGVKIVGVHRSSTNTSARFSPVSGVESDLGVVPLK